jgi:hypothetical protein
MFIGSVVSACGMHIDHTARDDMTTPQRSRVRAQGTEQSARTVICREAHGPEGRSVTGMFQNLKENVHHSTSGVSAQAGQASTHGDLAAFRSGLRFSR